jgi:medium-chain acyl-[acyl-carrier-protein] hydrolase
MPLIHRRTFVLPASDIDVAGRVTAGALFRAMQDAASANAVELGFGYEHLDPLGIFWVLSWVKLAVDRHPGMGDEVTIETWPKGPHKLFSLRDFTFEDARGIFARATTAWLLVDRRSKRIRPRESLPWELPRMPERAALNDLPDKPATDGPWAPILEHRIRYSDVDVNAHTNNTRYVDLACDAFDIDWHRAHDVASMTLRYLSETKSGDALVIHRRDGDATEVKGTAGEAVVFHARFEWRERVTG